MQVLRVLASVQLDPFLAQIWDNRWVMQLFLNEQHRSAIPVLWELLLEGVSESIVNRNIEEQHTLDGILLQRAWCVPAVYMTRIITLKGKILF